MVLTPPNGTRPVDDSPFNYLSVLKGIRTYFFKDQIFCRAALQNQIKGKFYKVYIQILTKISDEQFDANALSDTLCMSRAQLLRSLKLTGLNSANILNPSGCKSKRNAGSRCYC